MKEKEGTGQRGGTCYNYKRKKKEGGSSSTARTWGRRWGCGSTGASAKDAVCTVATRGTTRTGQGE